MEERLRGCCVSGKGGGEVAGVRLKMLGWGRGGGCAAQHVGVEEGGRGCGSTCRGGGSGGGGVAQHVGVEEGGRGCGSTRRGGGGRAGL